MPTITKSKLRAKLEAAGIPLLYTNENTPLEQQPVRARLFALGSGATWLIMEATAHTKDGKEKTLADAKDDELEEVIMFGYADLFQQGTAGGAELGYMSLNEMEELRFGIIPRIEFDEHFTPKPYAECVFPDGRIK
jgi:hypothetical protein